MSGRNVSPRITVVTPSYNQANLVGATLLSVLDQAYPNLEYIVIDGGSSDGSAETIRSYGDRLAYWVSEPDRGLADALNKGFLRSTGEVMAWINSSDVYYPWTLETVAQVFHDVPDAQWIMGVPSMLGRGQGPKSVHPGRMNVYDFLSGNYRWIQQESVFWRRSLWEATGGYVDTNVAYACDFELWLRFFRCACLHHVETVLGGFRVHQDRRAHSAENAYERESARLFRDFAKGYGPRDHIRASLIRLLNNRPGRFAKWAMSASPVPSWYAHPSIEYDFARERWVVHST